MVPPLVVATFGQVCPQPYNTFIFAALRRFFLQFCLFLAALRTRGADSLLLPGVPDFQDRSAGGKTSLLASGLLRWV
jgi:hypothetical protein